jgi:hypothetical protein
MVYVWPICPSLTKFRVSFVIISKPQHCSSKSHLEFGVLDFSPQGENYGGKLEFDSVSPPVKQRSLYKGSRDTESSQDSCHEPHEGNKLTNESKLGLLCLLALTFKAWNSKE